MGATASKARECSEKKGVGAHGVEGEGEAIELLLEALHRRPDTHRDELPHTHFHVLLEQAVQLLPQRPRAVTCTRSNLSMLFSAVPSIAGATVRKIGSTEARHLGRLGQPVEF